MLDKSQLQAQGIHTIDTTPPPESQKLIALLKEHAPHAFRDGKLDFKALTRLLGEEAEYASYELNFLGKREANKLSNTPATKELKSEPDRSSEFNTTGNAIIIGDNLHALKTLKSAYYGKVKMIYIDPPYNTGSDGFIYRDHFGEDYKNILRELNLMEFNDDGEEMLSKRINYFKNIFGDKTHSGWLSFMYPRLKLARELLRDDGVIFISIDDNEQANLKILCDEIFGEHNFVACLCVIDNLKGNNNTDGIVSTNEYCLVYAKNISSLTIGEMAIQDEDNKELAKWHKDDLGYWKEGRNIKGTGENAPREKRPSMFYPIYLDDNLEISLTKSERFYIEVLPITNGQEMCWNWSKSTLEKNKHELIVKKTKSGYNFIKKQRPNIGDMPSQRIKTTCYSPKYSTSTSAQTIKNLFSVSVFNYTKSVYLIRDFLEISTNDNDIVMDFFAGSGTTAHAVMELNAEDRNNGKQGNRKFILVQLDEAIDEKANKVAYDFCKSLGSENPTIADITIERVKRAGEKIRGEQIKKEKGGDSTIDTGFKVFSLIDKQRLNPQEQDLLTLASSPLTPYQKAINLALHAGRTLDTRIQPVIEGKLYRDERNFYLIACDKEVQKHLTADKNKDIFLSGYEDIAIQDLLNLQASIQKTRLKVLF